MEIPLLTAASALLTSTQREMFTLFYLLLAEDHKP